MAKRIGKKQPNRGEIAIFKAKFGPEIRVNIKNETIWLAQEQIASVFSCERSVITKHINNIFVSGELKEKSNVQKLHIAISDKPVKIYSLDVILSVGYRVNSKKATQFRIWATKILKDYLVKGYAVNESRILLVNEHFLQLQRTIEFLQTKAKTKLLAGRENEILALLGDYAKTLRILEQYDRDAIVLQKGIAGKFILNYADAIKVIEEIKNGTGDLFGIEYEGKFKGIIGAIQQTFGGEELYRSIEEKAAHLLYFVIKDHPFADGNKRIASFLFVYFLDRNKYLYRTTGERKINDNALAVLALLIAISNPKEKDKMIGIVTNLLAE
ncbi:MAG: virulence protein RhuM/Fic/DOC family protein [Candidatus Paceibacterota bacterium]